MNKTELILALGQLERFRDEQNYDFKNREVRVQYSNSLMIFGMLTQAIATGFITSETIIGRVSNIGKFITNLSDTFNKGE